VIEKAKFYLYKKQTRNGPVWYACFLTENGKTECVRSTSVAAKGNGASRGTAYNKAMEMLPTVRRAKQKTGEQLFTDYVQDFWSEGSAYVREAAQVKKKPLSAAYLLNNRNAIKNHVIPFPPMKGLALKDVTAGIIRDWRTWAAEKGMSGRQINTTVQAMSVAVRYTIDRGELETDPFKKIGKAKETPREKGILTPAEERRLITITTHDPREKAAVLLGAMCGMRRGEVRGLQWGDIDTAKQEIHIFHNYQDLEGVKGCKSGSNRIVPLPTVVANTLEAVRRIHVNPTDTAFVFESINIPGRPHCPEYFVNALRHCMEVIGIEKEAQKRRNITLHSLRHSFVTLGRLAGLNDFEIQSLAGHKSSAMMDRYSHGTQVVDMDSARQRIEAIAV
jgi:integrase